MTTCQGIKALLVTGWAVFLSTPAYAVDFSLNFQPTTNIWSGQTGFCGGTVACPQHLGNGDTTPFELTLQDIGGVTYFHTLVGDPTSGFAIESYTRWAAGPNNVNPPSDLPAGGGDYSPDSGGNERSVIGTTAETVASYWQNASNLSNPFDANSHVSGTGTGDPTQTVFRMVMTSAKGDMSLEVDKPFLDKKPLISQTIQDGTMSSTFVADMRSISYSDMNTPVPIVNNLKISDPSLGGAADFEMALSQHSTVTAGRFIYTPGAGWNNPNGWDNPGSVYTPGTYTYFDANGFDPFNYDWASNFHYDENAYNCAHSDLGVSRDTLAGGASCPGHP